MATTLPLIPRVVFTILEPLSLLAGALSPLLNRAHFIQGQLPDVSKKTGILARTTTPTPSEEVLALQLGSCYFQLMLIGLGVLWTTKEARVVRVYLLACAAADLTHIAATIYMVGFDGTLNVAGWSDVTWGNIMATLFLFLVRVAYFAGLFGSDQSVSKRSRTKKRA